MNKEEIRCVKCKRTCKECGLDELGVVEGIGVISLRELEKERYELWFVCEDCWSNKKEKIAILKTAGYDEAEIVALKNNGYDFDEAVYLVRQGHTKDEIEKNCDELMRKLIDKIKNEGSSHTQTHEQKPIPLNTH